MKITIRLRDGKDEKIKIWYKELERGEKSRIIRGILKDYIHHNERKMGDFDNNHGMKHRKSEISDVDIRKNNPDDPENVEEKVDNLLENL